MENNTRRNVLKLVGSTATLGIAEPAASAAAEPPNHGPKVEYDLRIRNVQQDSTLISVAIYEKTEREAKASETPAVSRSFELGGSGTGSTVTQSPLNLPGGTYIVEASSDDGAGDRATLGVPAGGVPDWKGVLIRLGPGEGLNVGIKEI